MSNEETESQKQQKAAQEENLSQRSSASDLEELLKDDEEETRTTTTSASSAAGLLEKQGDDNDEEGMRQAATSAASEEELEAYDKFHLVPHPKEEEQEEGEVKAEEQEEQQNKQKPEEQKERRQQQQQNSKSKETKKEGEGEKEPQFQEHGMLLSQQEKLKTQPPPQHFDYFLLLDFECTCSEDPGYHNEVIELPALLFDTKTLRVVDEFHTYVRPLRNLQLSKFCKDLTGIQQDQVSQAICYDEALEQLVSWVHLALAKQKLIRQQQENEKNNDSNNNFSTEELSQVKGIRTDGTNLCVLTDGPCDLELFAYLFMHKRDGFNFPSVFHRYLDVKEVFRSEYGQGRFMKIRDMLLHFGLKFQGQQHSGIDDTRNIARIVSKMIENGTVFDRVHYVTLQSGKQKVPQYLWTRAKMSVKKAAAGSGSSQQKGGTSSSSFSSSSGGVSTIGLGPTIAKLVREGKLSTDLTSSQFPQHQPDLFRLVASNGGVNCVSPPSSSSSFPSLLGSGNGTGNGMLLGDHIVAHLRSIFLVQVQVRRGEFMTAPATPLLILLLAVFISSFFW